MESTIYYVPVPWGAFLTKIIEGNKSFPLSLYVAPAPIYLSILLYLLYIAGFLEKTKAERYGVCYRK